MNLSLLNVQVFFRKIEFDIIVSSLVNNHKKFEDVFIINPLSNFSNNKGENISVSLKSRAPEYEEDYGTRSQHRTNAGCQCRETAPQ